MAPPSLKNPTTNAPTSSTLWGTASNGAPIVQIGALQPYTDPNGVTSPAETGIRVVDSSGDLIFDTVGVSAVMTSQGQVRGSALSQTTSSTTPVAITGASVTFTLTRATRVLVLGDVVANMAAATTTGNSELYVDGTDESAVFGGTATMGYFNSTNYQMCPMFWSQTLAAGSHTIALYMSVDSGSDTMKVLGFDLYVFGLGV